MWAERTACTAKKRLPTAALSPPQRQQRTTYFLQQPPSPVWPVKLKSVTDSGGAIRGELKATVKYSTRGEARSRDLQWDASDIFKPRRKKNGSASVGRDLPAESFHPLSVQRISGKDGIGRRIFFGGQNGFLLYDYRPFSEKVPHDLFPVVLAPSFTG